MAIADYTLFIDDINVPGANRDNITQAIGKYEPEVLRDLLGYRLYNDVINNQGNYSDLINGTEFNFKLNGETIYEKWGGLKQLIAYYVYFKHRQDTDSFYSGVGQVNALSENAENVDTINKMVYVWRKMRELYGLDTPCYRNNETYEHKNDRPSAFNFLLANLSDYPNWVFKAKKSINVFGI